MGKAMQFDATPLRGGTYAIRPVGALGTCGWVNGEPWTVRYLRRPPRGIPIRKD